jgi:uracil-DNA glycosylase family 4
MTTTVGAPAPDFTLPASSGGMVSLSDLRGKTVVLYFYPKDDTPGWTKEACAFRDANRQFAGANAVVLGVSTDSLSSHAKFIEKFNLPFTLLADEDHKVAEAYGVWAQKSFAGKQYMGIDRSTFVIDPDGILRAEFRGVKVDGHVDEVLEAVPTSWSMSTQAAALERLARRVVRCTRCPRLVQYRREVARVKRRAFRDETYWGRPLPGFGDSRARLFVVGLAPAAHGGNRTGRIFTGDRSGDWLYASLHAVGLANQPVSVRRDDGLRLRGVYIAAAARCAPPANRPLPEELDNCRPYLIEELRLLSDLRAVVALGGIAWDSVLRAWAQAGLGIPRPRPRFAHGARLELADRPVLFGAYHPSQQNTFTKRLTRPMLDRVFREAAGAAGLRW